jgi:hypothetical protein
VDSLTRDGTPGSSRTTPRLQKLERNETKSNVCRQQRSECEAEGRHSGSALEAGQKEKGVAYPLNGLYEQG